VDPKGRFAAHSIPQGVGNFGTANVTDPAAGTWTGVIFGDMAGQDGLHGTNGTVPWQVTTERYASFGSVSPARFTLAPGASQVVRFSASLPASAGDAAGAIVIRGAGPATTIPVTLRSLILVSRAAGGAFSGTLTGGNGRQPGVGQVDYYQFRVGQDAPGITASVTLGTDTYDNVGAYLVGPDGNTGGYGQNSFYVGMSLVQSRSLTAYALRPAPGTWTLIIDFASPVTGDVVAQRFTGSVRLAAAAVTAPGLPGSARTKLPRGKKITIPVRITNTGTAPEFYFLDPRLNATASYRLANYGDTSLTLPLTTQAPAWLVPAETSGVTVSTAGASLPVMFDYHPVTGDPDLTSSSGTCTPAPSATYQPPGGRVTAGIWTAGASECGPYPAAGAPAGRITAINMQATTSKFDQTITSGTGDYWLQAIGQPTGCSDVYCQRAVAWPGQTVTIKITITPAGRPGTAVSGTLYIGDLLNLTDGLPPYGQAGGDEVAALHYEYVIG
jgi:hypothetical protein